MFGRFLNLGGICVVLGVLVVFIQVVIYKSVSFEWGFGKEFFLVFQLFQVQFDYLDYLVV